MAPRADDNSRRGASPRRGTSRDLPADGEAGEASPRGFAGIGDARAYTPRGRTMAERDQRTRSPRAGRTTDPFRPALQVLDGGKPKRGRGRAPEPETAPADEPEFDEADVVEVPAPRSRRPEPVHDDYDDEDFADFDEEPVRRPRVSKSRPGAASRLRGAAGLRGGAGGRTGRPGPPPRRRVTVVAEPPKLANSTRRLRLGTVLALSLFAMIGIRLVVLQVASSPGDVDKLEKLRADRTTTVKLPAERGSILDRNGQVLAHSVEARYVAVDPTLVKNADAEAASLSPMIGVPVSTLLPLMRKHTRPGGGQARFEYLAQGVDITAGDKVAALKLAGIVVRQDERRDVPNADLAANLIGFTGSDNSGLGGIEAKYDSLLRGSDGEWVYENGKGQLDKPIPGGYQHYVDPQPGTSLQLTIDDELQFEVQKYLSESAAKWNASMAGAVVIDVRTGEVLAQASYPTYNAAKPGDSTAAERDDVPSGIVADPGSVHKAFTIGAALQEGVITPDSTQVVGPAIMRGGYQFKDDHPFAKGTKLTIPQVLAYSSNVGSILIADKLGKDKLYEYQQKFGLGKSTNEGMLGEATGRIIPPGDWSPSTSGSVPIGMSVDATLVQMAAGYAAIANDGTYIQPHLIKSMISGKDGKVTQAAAPETHQVLTPKVAQELRTMMEAVVDFDGATGTQAKVPGYQVSGKTGTGKRLVDGQYTSYNYGSFIGMAPAENPRFVVAVSADVPHGSGGDVAAPGFSQMMQYALARYRVPPSSTTTQKVTPHS